MTTDRASHSILISSALLMAMVISNQAAPPPLLSYQGRVTTNGAAFTGTGQFKFALVSSNGTASFWSNDGQSVAGSEPSTGVALPVANGLYSVLLGDTNMSGMAMAIPAAVFAANDDVRLRVWFNDGRHGVQLLSPDQRMTSVGYALTAERLTGVLTDANLQPGTIGASKLDPGLGVWTRSGSDIYYPVGRVGIDTPQPVSPLHIGSFNEQGECLTLGVDPHAGGYTALTVGLTAERSGSSFIQSIRESGQSYGDLTLNAAGGDTGVGTALPKATLHVGSDEGKIPSLVVGGDPTAGGATALVFSLTKTSNGQSTIQSVQASGSAYGDLLLNRDGGKVGIGTPSPASALDVAGEVTMTACNITSDRNAKDSFTPVSPRDVLNKLRQLSITEWQYKTQPGVRHIGPMAQDFKAAFAVGRDERHITTVDADGVALAAIQGLTQVIEEKEEEISKIREINRTLGRRLLRIESRLGFKDSISAPLNDGVSPE